MRTRWRTIVGLGLVAVSAIPGIGLAQRNSPARRGASGVVVPMTDVSITLGKETVNGHVDADCHVDERATAGSTRAYFVARYPWFGQRVADDKPQWRFDLEIRRGKTSEASDQFVFSFLDGQRTGG